MFVFIVQFVSAVSTDFFSNCFPDFLDCVHLHTSSLESIESNNHGGRHNTPWAQLPLAQRETCSYGESFSQFGICPPVRYWDRVNTCYFFYKNIDFVCEPQRSYFQPHCNCKAKAFLLQVFIFELENPSIIMKHDKSFILNNYKKKIISW